MTNHRNFDRAELVRLRRMRQCHEEDRPTEREIAAALAAFGAERRRRSARRFPRTLAIAASVTLSTLGAFATTEKLGFTTLTARFRSQEAPQALPSPSIRPPPTSRTRSPAPSMPEPTVPVVAPTPDEPEAAAPRRIPSGPAMVDAPPQATGTAAEAWSKAATALKLGDHAAAQDALKELARSDDAETRASALLARAELDLVNGEEERARAVLTALAERGATPFVRQRARQILAGER
jgi:hypothetical protein